jgi:hypothetical protein
VARAPFSNEDLQRLHRSFLFSPKQYVNCGRGHGVDMALSAWKLKKDRKGWYAELKCSDSQWREGGLESAGYSVKCSSHARLDLPDDLSGAMVPASPGHSSTAWRDGAALLPRFDGIYTCTTKIRRSLSEPKKYEDWCLAFSAAGEVVNFEMRHGGYGKDYAFSVRLGLITRHAYGGRDLFAQYGPDLFRVDGASISWTWIHPDGSRTQNSGVIQRGGKKMELTATSDPAKAKVKRDFEFRPLRIPPFT